MKMKQQGNAEFDEELRRVKDIKWLPWIGENFDKYKMIILGESQYEDEHYWQEGNEEATRTLITKGFDDGFGRIQNVTAKVLLSLETPTEQQKQILWNSVSYHNLVQELMSSIAQRPKDLNYDNGWRIFLTIAEILKPEICVVLGKSSCGRLGYYLNNNETGWQRNVSEFYEKEKVIHLTKNDYKLKLIFINHPTGSYGFKFEIWADLLKKNGVDLSAQLI